ncbi:MAG: TlpA family protein disulfide reductase [Betaproteobacteria bacterium]|nr:TlpA family protein disulfide reductase [Betaproteobacteria bacterium]
MPESRSAAERAITPVRLALGTLGIAVLIAAGIGVYLSLAPADRPAGIAQPPGGFPLRLHSAPKTLANVTFEDGSGRRLTLADFRGKIVLLNIWATWCPPCRKEMPALDRLEQQLGGPGFQVLALSIDRGGTVAVQSFYEEIDVRALKVYVDASGQAPDKLSVVGLPTTLLIDAAGYELGRLTGPAEWDSPEAVATIRRYLGTPEKS